MGRLGENLEIGWKGFKGRKSYNIIFRSGRGRWGL
jgi:hypothetical protein